MSQLPTPPASRPGSEAPGTEGKPAGTSSELLQSLDTLLEEYLRLLNRQQQLHSGLAKQVSSGFLALAHANYTCPPGRRYGADYYDERMKAIRTVSIKGRQEVDQVEPPKEATKDHAVEAEKPSAPDFEYNFCLTARARTQPEEKTEEETDAKEETAKPVSDLSQNTESSQRGDATSATDEKEPPTSTDADDSGSAPQTSKTTPKKFRSDDPIHWYGILVPPSLRTAQKSFTDAIQGQVPELAGAIVEMRVLEERITQLRKELGIPATEDVNPQ